MNFRLRPMTPTDWPRVAEIYQEGIATGDATFETTVPSWDQWDAGHMKACRSVAVEDTNRGTAASYTIGWAALSPVSRRDAYKGIGEVSVYVAREAWGRGVGRALLTRLVEESEANGLWALRAGIMAENTTSIRLHERCGFRVVGHYERPAKLNDVWRNTVLMERRSTVVGVQ